MFKDRIRQIFGYGVEEYKETPNKGEIYFELARTEFTAEKLFALSDLLGTGTIGIEAGTRDGGYCPTCSFEYGVMEVTARGVDFKNLGS